MATNKSTINALNHMNEIIDEIDITSIEEFTEEPKKLLKLFNELKAWSRLNKKHLQQQSRQDGQYEDDRYEYNQDTQKIQRIRNGEVITEY